MTTVTGREVDRGRLARDLNHAVSGEVRFDQGSRALYANDASIYRQVPIGVVLPRGPDDVLATLEVARRYDAPIVARGGGTGLAGQSVNAAVMLDFSKYMNRIVELDPGRRLARVQPGVICDQLRDAAAEHGLTFAPDPATHDRCTVGGMVGNNSCGVHSVMGGKTVDNVLSLDVVTYDGVRMRVGPTDDAAYDAILAGGGRPAQIYRDLRDLGERYGDLVRERYPQIPRRVSGYNLDELQAGGRFDVARALVGTESTCTLVLEATLRLIERPTRRSLLVVGFPDAASAADHVPAVMETEPIGLECFDDQVVRNLVRKGVHYPGMEELPSGQAWLLAEFGGDTDAEAHDRANRCADRVHSMGTADARLFDDPDREAEVWEVRRSSIGSTRIPGEHGGHAAWEDAAVPPERLGDYLRDFTALTREYGYRIALYGHFGQGCVHCRHDLDLVTAEGIENFRRFVTDAADLVVSYGGSLSGEHGDGQLRASLLPKMYGSELVEAFREFKEIFDPGHRMNPGKVVDPYRPDQNIRLGTSYRPRQVETHFSYTEDRGGFADAVNRCFGIGKCRHASGGVMCPSFMVTGEEMHSTRGRARLLFEMMRDEGQRDRFWRDENVKQALDLCLACKGCKSDCPVNVDMATYKAEFLSHYYAGRLRPRAAYALGLIPLWARLASRTPGLANTATNAPLIGRAIKATGGVAAGRDAPPLAGRSFRDWFAGRRTPAGGQGRPVLLWPDTFTNYFEPEVGIAATEVLEAAGFSVRLPDRVLCCGRPLYDYGMVPTARRWLRTILTELADEIVDGVPVVGLEPSCLAVFRDELPNLFPDDMQAFRLSRQAWTLSELLARNDVQTPRLLRSALVQTHCHHHAVMGFDADGQLMEAMGLDVDRPDSGCCGMAGSFGYERGERYEVSRACGERVILPRVRDAPKDTLVLADGFSCRQQIAAGTDRRALHLAQAMQVAMRYGPQGPSGDYPERPCQGRRPRADRTLAVAVAGVGAAVALGARALTRR